MIWKMIYNTIGIAAIFTGFQVASLFNAKIRQGILARKTAFRQLEEQLELVPDFTKGFGSILLQLVSLNKLSL